LFSNDYAGGGSVDETSAGGEVNGGGGSANTDTGQAYAGGNGVLVVRYLYQ
jgi:hypothetical protein